MSEEKSFTEEQREHIRAFWEQHVPLMQQFGELKCELDAWRAFDDKFPFYCNEDIYQFAIGRTRIYKKVHKQLIDLGDNFDRYLMEQKIDYSDESYNLADFQLMRGKESHEKLEKVEYDGEPLNALVERVYKQCSPKDQFDAMHPFHKSRSLRYNWCHKTK